MRGWDRHNANAARVDLEGESGRTVQAYIDGNAGPSETFKDGKASLELSTRWLRTKIDDATIYFQYTDGDMEKTEELTGAEWRALFAVE